MKLLSTIHFQLSTIALIIAFAGCAPQAPQRPSQRSGQTPKPDSMTLAMVELHQRLVDAADVELINYIRNHPDQWISQNDGSWYSPNLSAEGAPTNTNNSKLSNQTATLHSTLSTLNSISLRLITRDLDGKLLSDVEGEYELGKCQLPEAVENVITTQLSTFNFKIAAPWYVAYGSKGNDAVPQYQNVIIEVYIL